MKLRYTLSILFFLGSTFFLFNNCSPTMDSSTSNAFSQSIEDGSFKLPSAGSTVKKHFKVLWLEPHTLNQNVFERDNQPNSHHVFEMFEHYKEMGVEKVVIAYSEYLDYFMFDASRVLRTNYPAAQTVLTLADGTPILDVLFKAADASGIKLIVGLSPFGDKNLLLKLEADMISAKEKRISDATKIFKPSNIEALTRQILLNQMLANDLFFKYQNHPSFYGWYLVQEPHCMDVAMNYFGPIAKFIKKLDATKKIMVSPNADAESCFRSSSSTRQQLISNYRALLNDAKASGIDIIAYQDSIGAAYQAGVGQFISYGGALLESHRPFILADSGSYHYSDLGREMRLNYIEAMSLPALREAHISTNVEFWMNTELWRMDGNCVGKTLYYGCPYGSDTFAKQLNAWWEFTDHLMLNEGFTQFDFSHSVSISISNKGHQDRKPARENSIRFTRDYRSHLGLPPL